MFSLKQTQLLIIFVGKTIQSLILCKYGKTVVSFPILGQKKKKKSKSDSQESHCWFNFNSSKVVIILLVITVKVMNY